MPSFDCETSILWRWQRVVEYCRLSKLKLMFRRELKKFEKEALNSPEMMAQWLLNRHSEHSIVQQCSNKAGKTWLEGQTPFIKSAESNRKKMQLRQKLAELGNTGRYYR